MDFAVLVRDLWFAHNLMIYPLYVLAVVLVFLMLRQQTNQERQLFSSRVHHAWAQLGRQVLVGVGVAILLAVAVAGLGLRLQPQGVALLWLLSLLGASISLRWLSFVYASLLLALLHLTWAMLPVSWQEWTQPWSGWLANLDVPSLMMFAAVLQIVEALLWFVQNRTQASPILVPSKRGKIVGGFKMQYFWPVPLLAIVPAFNSAGWTLPWEPWLAAEWSTMGWFVLALPLLLGQAEWSQSRQPNQMIKMSAYRALAVAAWLLILGIASVYYGALSLLYVLLALLGKEIAVWWIRYQEREAAAFWVQSGSELLVQAILPDSPAARMGILPGERIYRVNGVKVNDSHELHQAIMLNPAYCKMEIRNLQGELKFANRSLYEGEHYQLGLLFAPDEHADQYTAHGLPNIWRAMFGRIQRKRQPGDLYISTDNKRNQNKKDSKKAL